MRSSALSSRPIGFRQLKGYVSVCTSEYPLNLSFCPGGNCCSKRVKVMSWENEVSSLFPVV
ncbi:hypothetical protein COLO4_20041 [Corchorus olitorius]|uniref:Uncharacterized protein n=1 Tax=Corchorus olitorius TaxID=93759 RepID=A0A1R3J209_9ROSI|nr:hypothetical protein COLO4_20041 [Corchorus olitorius]